MKQPAVYIMASDRNGTLYIGVTSALVQRTWQHRNGSGGGFTARYGCKLLVWFEPHETMESAILREKQIKGGSRQSKLKLIEGGQCRLAGPVRQHRPSLSIMESTSTPAPCHFEEPQATKQSSCTAARRQSSTRAPTNRRTGLLRYARNDGEGAILPVRL